MKFVITKSVTQNCHTLSPIIGLQLMEDFFEMNYRDLFKYFSSQISLLRCVSLRLMLLAKHMMGTETSCLEQHIEGFIRLLLSWLLSVRDKASHPLTSLYARMEKKQQNPEMATLWNDIVQNLPPQKWQSPKLVTPKLTKIFDSAIILWVASSGLFCF